MQLLSPGFLIALLVVGIPVIIHLLQLRKVERLQFTNTEFIRQLDFTASQRRRVKEWLVLLARVAGLICLVLAFCKPFIPALVSRGEGVAETVGILLDDTPSMRAPGSSGSLYQQAVAEAALVGQAYGGRGRFRIVNEGRQVLTEDSYAGKLQLRAAGEGPGYSRSAIDGLSTNTQDAAPGPLYILSDFQKNTATAAWLGGLDKKRQVLLLPQTGQRVANLTVDSVWVEEALVQPGTNVDLHVRVRNGGQVAAAAVPVKVFLGAQQAAAFQVSVAAGQAVSSVVQVRVKNETQVRGRVVTEDGPVAFDNTHYFTLQPVARIQVLEIGTVPVAERVYANEPVFSYRFNPSEAVDYGQLRRADMVLVHAVAQLAPGLRAALVEATRRGATVVVVPPATRASQASYQQLFRDLDMGTAQWEAEAGPSGSELREVAMPGARQLFFRDVFGAQQRQTTMPRAAPVLRWARTEEDILKFRDGESYLARFGVGAGQAYVFAAPFELPYSDFTTHALFVPVLYRLALLSYRNSQLPAYRLTQPGLSLTLPPEKAGEDGRGDAAGFELVKDSVRLIPGQRVRQQELRLEVPAGLRGPGFYELRQRGRLVTTLAFNEDKRESELVAYSAADLRRLTAGYPNVRVLESGAGATQLRAGQTDRPLWRWFVGAALACLLVEVLLLRVGRRGPTAATSAA